MGTIYEIICWTTGLRYIGQTTRTLKERLWYHQYHLDSSARLVLEHGNYEIYELDIVEDESLLRERELYFIQHTDCVNKQTGAYNIKEYNKQYSQTEKGKEKRKVNHKKYQQSEKGKAASKRYREKKKNLKNRELLNAAVPSLL